MGKKVSVENLKVGVFIEKIGQNWFSSPFLFNKFHITSEDQIKLLKDHAIKEVYIDTERGIDPTLPAPSVEKKQTFDYIPISTERLLLDTIIPFDLFTKQTDDYSLYLRSGLPYHSEVQYYLESNSIPYVYISSTDKEVFEKYENSIQKEKKLSQKGLAGGFESQEKVEQYNHYLNNYMPVDSNIFVPGTKVPLNLFLEKDAAVTHILEADSIVPENEIFSWKEITEERVNLLIHLNEKNVYKKFLNELASRKSSDDSEKALRARMAVIKENSKLVTKDLMDNPRSGDAVKEAENTVLELIANVLENPSSFYGLMTINTYDYYTYIHSVNVCTLSIGLGMVSGLEKKDLYELAVGALMHDVGKSRVPSRLINKPGKLTDHEFAKVQNHVNRGYSVLKQHKSLPKRAFIPLLQHHEKLNGTGYPNKLSGRDIHLFGRISAIVDVYDALTTERAYKKAFKPFDAVNFLAKNKDVYDQDIFKKFVAMLGKQQME